MRSTVIPGTAMAGNCEYIVTGDKDLLDLRQVEGVRIISLSAFWATAH
jgi:predicted nucleic acid-binding protein